MKKQTTWTSLSLPALTTVDQGISAQNQLAGQVDVDYFQSSTSLIGGGISVFDDNPGGQIMSPLADNDNRKWALPKLFFQNNISAFAIQNVKVVVDEMQVMGVGDVGNDQIFDLNDDATITDMCNAPKARRNADFADLASAANLENTNADTKLAIGGDGGFTDIDLGNEGTLNLFVDSGLNLFQIFSLASQNVHISCKDGRVDSLSMEQPLADELAFSEMPQYQPAQQLGETPIVADITAEDVFVKTELETFVALNPFSQKATIYFSKTGKKKLVLVNEEGETFEEWATDGRQFEIPSAGLQPGIYFLKIEFETKLFNALKLRVM